MLVPVSERHSRDLPRLVIEAVRLVGRAAPRELALTVGLQVLWSIGLAGEVLVARKLLSAFLQLAHGGGRW